MWKHVQTRIDGHALHQSAQRMLRNPADHIRTRRSILERIAPRQTIGALAGEKAMLTPSVTMLERMRTEVLHRIGLWQPIPAWHRAGKWVAATVVLTLLLRLTPTLFLASPLQAESRDLLLPTAGIVSITDGAEWSVIPSELELKSPLTVRTGNESAATIIIHDTLLRLFENTEVILYDAAFVGDTKDPIARIAYGQVWASSMLPEVLLSGMTITLPQGMVALKDGSINILADPQQSTIQVFHRFARILPIGGEPIHLIQNDQLTLLPGGDVQRNLVTEALRSEEWVQENLAKDAAHRAQMAEESQKMAESVAGILPDSAFYFLKRASESLDLSLTVSGMARNEKKIRHAQTRLNEAVALLKAGKPAIAEQSLADYREAIHALASMNEEEARNMLISSLADSTLALADSLPHSLLYSAKATVIGAAADATASEITPAAVDLYLLSDALLEIESRIAQGEVNGAWAAFKGIEGAVSSILENQTLNGEPVSKDDLKVMKTILRSIAFSLEQARATTAATELASLDDFKASIDGNVPMPQPTSVAGSTDSEQCMNLQEIARRVNQFLSSVFTYKTPRGQRNEVLHQISLLPECVESGRVLTKVMNKVPVFTRSFVWDALQKMEATL